MKGLKIGVVKEGFGHANSEKDVDASVREAAKRFKSLGASVEEVSIPDHLIAPAIWTPIALEGLQAQMMLGNGMGFNWKGLYTVSLLDAHANWRQTADDLSDSLKISMMVGPVFPRPTIAGASTRRRKIWRARSARPTTRRSTTTISC